MLSPQGELLLFRIRPLAMTEGGSECLSTLASDQDIIEAVSVATKSTSRLPY